MRWGLLLLLVGCGRLHFGAADAGGGGDDDAIGDGHIGDGRPPTLTNNAAFILQVTDVGALGGLAGADAACQAAADAVPIPGLYRAWLSTNSVNAIDRLAGARGWVRPDGIPFADTGADIVSGRTLSPLIIDVNGVHVTNIGVVSTGTLANGTSSGSNCISWTSTTGGPSGGNATAAGAWFTDNGATGGGCMGPGAIYCFGVARNEPLLYTLMTGRVAFLSTPWSPGGGLSDADAHCQADATGRGLAQTFIAALGVSTNSEPKHRLNMTGPTWVRLDGVPLAATAADLFLGGLSGTTRLAPLNLTIDGTYVGLEHVWTGYAPTSPTHCSDWVQTGGGQLGGTSDGPFQIGNEMHGAQTQACNAARRLYCLEP